MFDKEIDLYEILPDVDVLITDYSSIYFDFLLLDRPIVFINNDIKEYINARGLLLNPYDFWTPGFKVDTQRDLEEKLMLSINHPDYYKKERETVKSIMFEVENNKSREKIWEIIKSKKFY